MQLNEEHFRSMFTTDWRSEVVYMFADPKSLHKCSGQTYQGMYERGMQHLRTIYHPDRQQQDWYVFAIRYGVELFVQLPVCFMLEANDVMLRETI